MNDIRKHINLVESQELDEAGGMIDRLLSKLPGGIGAGAEGRVDNKEMFKLLKKGWLKYAASIKADKKDSQELMDYLGQASLSDEQIDQLPLDGNINLNDVFQAAAGMVIKNAGADFSGDKKGDVGGKQTAKGSPTGDSKDEIMKFFRKMGGDPRELTKEFREARSIKKLNNNKDHLGALGYSHLEKTAGA